MKLPTSKRIADIQTPMIPIVGEWIAQHPGTISLGQGIVHYDPPAEVGAAVAQAAIAEPHIHRYGPFGGTDELLQAINRKLHVDNNVTVGKDRRVVVTAGSNMGFLNAILAIADLGDEIILLRPYYFNHQMAIEIAGCRTIDVPTDDRYQPDVAAIESAITDRTRAIVTISPNNPTGAVYDRSTLERINQLCAERDLYHIADEAYEYFVYDDVQHFSPPSLPHSESHTIGLYSLSKSYGMAGWRVGYMLIPEHLESAIKTIQDTNLICPPLISQTAATAALTLPPGWRLRQTAGFGAVRDLVLGALERLGDRVRVPKPGGAFYVLAEILGHSNDLELVESLIRDHGVAVMPGSTFGVTDPCCLRIAYGALDPDTVSEGMGRLVRGLESLI
jgi:aspartate/methionine/tyrosine aminotransferase